MYRKAAKDAQKEDSADTTSWWINLKDSRFPGFGRQMASNDVTRDGRNDSKSERSDGKDADHCGEKTVVVREWRASWM